MDKYTLSEESYKRGREDAIDVLSHRIFLYVMCRDCPASKFCTAENGCANAFAEWMRGLFEEEGCLD